MKILRTPKGMCKLRFSEEEIPHLNHLLTDQCIKIVATYNIAFFRCYTFKVVDCSEGGAYKIKWVKGRHAQIVVPNAVLKLPNSFKWRRQKGFVHKDFYIYYIC